MVRQATRKVVEEPVARVMEEAVRSNHALKPFLFLICFMPKARSTFDCRVLLLSINRSYSLTKEKARPKRPGFVVLLFLQHWKTHSSGSSSAPRLIPLTANSVNN